MGHTTGEPETSTTLRLSNGHYICYWPYSESESRRPRTAGIETHRGLGRDDGPTHVPEAIPVTGSQPGPDRWQAEGAADHLRLRLGSLS
jgi:hypothetical protein